MQQRRTTEFEYAVNAPPERVFPLLCPVREYEWIEGWQCEMVYSDSGFAEDNCIFRTHHTAAGPMTWCVSRYEPPRRIEFVIVGENVTTRLRIELEATAGGTHLRWRRVFTALSEAGNPLVHGWSDEMERGLADKLRYFLETGKMLVTERSPAPAR